MRLPCRATSLPASRRAGLYADLLAKDRSHSQLEAVPTAWSAQARPLRNPWTQILIEREMLLNGLDFRPEIEQSPNPVHDFVQSLHRGKVNSNAETLFVRQVPDLNEATLFADLDGAFVNPLLDRFDSGDRPRSQEPQHGIPVIRCAVTDVEHRAPTEIRQIQRSFASEGARWTMKKIVKNLVEAS